MLLDGKADSFGEVGIIIAGFVRAGSQIRDLMAEFSDVFGERVLQLKSGVVCCNGDAQRFAPDTSCNTLGQRLSRASPVSAVVQTSIRPNFCMFVIVNPPETGGAGLVL